MTTKILDEITSTQNELMQLISSLTEEQINTLPFEGSWTAGQLAEHLIKSDSGMIKVMHGSTKASERPADEKVEMIRNIFLDFSTKMNAPVAIIPTESGKEKDRLLSKLSDITNSISEIIKTRELSEISLDFALPKLGEFTRLEWCYFVNYHTQRHIHQLKNIVEKVQEKAGNKS